MIKESYKKYFINQKMMRTVIISLIPIIIAATYFFGLRVLTLLAVVTAFGVATEYIFEKFTGRKISEAAFVSCILYTLTLPPSTPYWIAVVGIVFGLFFGKLVFGGFGRNVFNPALVGRAFVYISFPNKLTIEWSEAVFGGIGGFGTYLTDSIEAITEATPMLIFRETGTTVETVDLLIGNVAGSIGETSAILIILAGIYLIYKKVASWEIMAGCLIGFVGLNSILYALGMGTLPNTLFALLSGGFLFGTVFMATDPISAPKTKEGKWIFGIMVGAVSIIIRGFSLFAGGMMFAILISNTFVCILDEGIKELKKWRKESAKKKEVTA